MGLDSCSAFPSFVATQYAAKAKSAASQPHAVSWGWKRSKGPRNDFFMFAAPHSLGAGGGGHFAIFLDGDLLHGASGMSETFGNPCLASNPEFDIGRVEVWGLV